MDSELRQRKKPGPGGDVQSNENTVVKRSETIDRTFTTLIVIFVTALSIVGAGITLFPDHHVTASTVAFFDTMLDRFGLAPKVRE